MLLKLSTFFFPNDLRAHASYDPQFINQKHSPQMWSRVIHRRSFPIFRNFNLTFITIIIKINMYCLQCWQQTNVRKEVTLRLPHPSADSGTFPLSGQNPSERETQDLCEGLKFIHRSSARVNTPSSCCNLWNDTTLGAGTWGTFFPPAYLIKPFLFV